MQYSIVNLSNTVSDFRLDAEAYKNEYLEIEDRVRKKETTILGNEVRLFVKGIFDIRADVYVDDGVPFVRISNLKNMRISEDQLAYIPEEENQKYLKTFLEQGDIILSKTAYPAASLVTLKNCNASQDTIAVKLKKNSILNSRYLVVFLNCKYGYLQMERWFTGNIQTHLNLIDSKNIVIPVFSEKFQNRIAELFDASDTLNNKSKALYKQAEEHLLTELGLHNWQTQHVLSFVQNYESTQKAKRFDAEYFQPKYQYAMAKLGKSGKSIRDVASLTKRVFTPERNNKFEYIEISNISKDGYAESESILGINAPSRAQWIVKTGDVITSTVRPIRSLSALIESSQSGFVCSSGFAVLKPKNIAPELLLVFLKLPIVCEILDLHTTATMYPAISTADLLNIPISVPENDDVSQEIISLVKESREVRQASKKLLEISKQSVEIAIKQDENAAEDWLTKESNKLGVKLT